MPPEAHPKSLEKLDWEWFLLTSFTTRFLCSALLRLTLTIIIPFVASLFWVVIQLSLQILSLSVGPQMTPFLHIADLFTLFLITLHTVGAWYRNKIVPGPYERPLASFINMLGCLVLTDVCNTKRGSMTGRRWRKLQAQVRAHQHCLDPTGNWKQRVFILLFMEMFSQTTKGDLIVLMWGFQFYMTYLHQVIETWKKYWCAETNFLGCNAWSQLWALIVLKVWLPYLMHGFEGLSYTNILVIHDKDLSIVEY